MAANADYTIRFSICSAKEDGKPVILNIRVTDTPIPGKEDYCLPHKYIRYWKTIQDMFDDCVVVSDKLQVLKIEYNRPYSAKAILRYVALLKSGKYDFIRMKFFKMHLAFFGNASSTEAFYEKNFDSNDEERAALKKYYGALTLHYKKSFHWRYDSMERHVIRRRAAQLCQEDTFEDLMYFEMVSESQDQVEAVLSIRVPEPRDEYYYDDDVYSYNEPEELREELDFSDLNDPLMFCVAGFLADEEMMMLMDHIMDSTGWGEGLLKTLVEHYEEIVDDYVTRPYLLMSFGAPKTFAFTEAKLYRDSPKVHSKTQKKIVKRSKKMHKGHNNCIYNFLRTLPVVAKYIMENYDRAGTIEAVQLSVRLRKRFMTLSYEELVDSLNLKEYNPRRPEGMWVSEYTGSKPENIHFSINGLPYSDIEDLNVAETYDCIEAQQMQKYKEQQRQEALRKNNGGLGKRARRRGETSGVVITAGAQKKKGPVML
jgi:hypothetical protein